MIADYVQEDCRTAYHHSFIYQQVSVPEMNNWSTNTIPQPGLVTGQEAIQNMINSLFVFPFTRDKYKNAILNNAMNTFSF